LPTSPEEWERIADIFERAIALPPEERSRLVEEESDDAETRSILRRLIQEDAAAGDFLERAVARVPEAIETPDANLVGTVFHSRYRIEEIIGRGGAGTVYRAVDLHGECTVTIKLLNDDALGNRWLRRKFQSEAEALGRLDHPNIVRILDFGETERGEPFLAMEHVPGRTLRRELKNGPLALPFAAAIVGQVGAALDFAHRCGIVHRDLKPENIMLTGDAENGVAKVIDFGIAQVRGGHTETETGVRLIAGTTRYMAPEQLLGEPGEASDIYALGAMAYEMIAGFCPYSSDGPGEILKQQGAGRMRDLRDIRTDVSPRAWQLIRRALSFRAEDRPAGAAEFSRALAEALGRGAGVTRVTRRALALSAAGAAVSSPFVYRWREEAKAARVIEKVGAQDPWDEGFVRGRYGFDEEAPLADTGRQRWEAWRLTTSTQGRYSRWLSSAQKRLATRLGFRLILEARVREGDAYACLDLSPERRRYDINVGLDANRRPYVLLTTQVVPQVTGPAEPVYGDPDGYHRYELRYEPRLRQASLLIDGAIRRSGYAGVSQFSSPGELFFGVGVFFGAAKGIADFKLVRLEIG